MEYKGCLKWHSRVLYFVSLLFHKATEYLKKVLKIEVLGIFLTFFFFNIKAKLAKKC